MIKITQKKMTLPRLKPEIVAIVGPTATGKSELAVRLARRFNGEIVSVDSRQVYRGLNLGTGKITKKEMRDIPHHLLDVASPKRTFTAAQYKKLAERAIASILRRGRLPIICGGAGFYLDIVLGKITTSPVPPNTRLRRKLERLSTAALFQKLRKLDWRRAEKIDPQNPRRLIRAIEIAMASGQAPKIKHLHSPYRVIKLGLKLPPEKLKEKIRRRLQKRIRQGLVAEVKHLHREGLSWKRLDDLGLEYRYVSFYLRGHLRKWEMFEKLETAIYHYAKRQLTWFRRDHEIIWLDAGGVKLVTAAGKSVNNFLTKRWSRGS